MTPDTTILAAYAFTGMLALLVLFQLALAFGAPWGALAWGGQNKGALPTGFRVASGFSVLIYAFLAVIALDQVGVISLLPRRVLRRGHVGRVRLPRARGAHEGGLPLEARALHHDVRGARTRRARARHRARLTAQRSTLTIELARCGEAPPHKGKSPSVALFGKHHTTSKMLMKIYE